MQKINNYIIEKLHINKDTKLGNETTDKRYEAIIKYIDDYMKSLIPDIDKHRKIGRRWGSDHGERGLFIYVYKWRGISNDKFKNFHDAIEEHVWRLEEKFNFIKGEETSQINKSEFYIRVNYAADK